MSNEKNRPQPIIDVVFQGYPEEKERFKKRGFVRFRMILEDVDSRDEIEPHLPFTKEGDIFVYSGIEAVKRGGVSKIARVRYVWDTTKYDVKTFPREEDSIERLLPEIARLDSEGYTILYVPGSVILYGRIKKGANPNNNNEDRLYA